MGKYGFIAQTGTAEGGHRRRGCRRGLRRDRRDALRLRGQRYRQADERGEDRLAVAEGRLRGVRVRHALAFLRESAFVAPATAAHTAPSGLPELTRTPRR